MTEDLARTIESSPFEDWQLPAFIKPQPAPPQSVQPTLDLFDFWAPVRTGYEGVDYAAGQRHFAAAVRLAREFGSAPNLLVNIVGAMMRNGVGPIERGFIDALASKATVGITPEPISGAMLRVAVDLSCLTEDEIRYGEGDARSFLEIARSVRASHIIADFMVDAVHRTLGYGAPSFIWTVCAAAMLGGRH